MLNFSDDANVHVKTDAFDWRESWYCNFFDTESRFFGTAWHGVRPNQQRGEVVFVLFERGEPLIYHVDTHIPVDPDVGDERMAAGHHRFECLEPWRHWQVHYDDGKNRATVDWQQISEVCDWEEREAGGGDGGKEFLAAAKHFEAAGRIAVTADVDGRAIEFTGFGERDRAWGIRNYGPLTFSWWQTAQFADGDAMHAWAMADPEGEMRLYGFLHRDGVSRPAAKFTCEVEYDGEDGPPVRTKWHLVDDHDRELGVEEMTIMQELAFRTEADGAALETGRAHASQTKGLWYWTWQRMARADGVIGHGMVDLNLWRGHNRTSFEANGPFGALYPYGLESSPAAS